MLVKARIGKLTEADFRKAILFNRQDAGPNTLEWNLWGDLTIDATGIILEHKRTRGRPTREQQDFWQSTLARWGQGKRRRERLVLRDHLVFPYMGDNAALYRTRERLRDMIMHTLEENLNWKIPFRYAIECKRIIGWTLLQVIEVHNVVYTWRS